MKLKKVAALLLGAILLSSQTIFVTAETPYERPLELAGPVQEFEQVQDQNGYIGIAPLWINIGSISLSLGHSNGMITGFGSISAASGTTSIVAVFQIERLVNGHWQFVGNWNDSSDSSFLASSRSFPAPTGHTYRITVWTTVVRNGVPETVSTSTSAWF